LDQECQLRLQTEIELNQERLLREKAQESSEQANQQVKMLQEELQDKVQQFLSMKTSFEESLVEERQNRLSVEQTLSETKSVLDTLQDEFKKNEEEKTQKIAKLVGDVKQERHHRKLSEEIMKEMSSIIKTLQSELLKKDKLQQSMEETFKESLAHERERRLVSEQSLAEIKAAYESLQNELNRTGQRLLTEARDASFYQRSTPSTPASEAKREVSLPPRSNASKGVTAVEKTTPIENSLLNESVTTPKVLKDTKVEQRDAPVALPPRPSTPLAMRPLLMSIYDVTPSSASRSSSKPKYRIHARSPGTNEIPLFSFEGSPAGNATVSTPTAGETSV
jgi:hypothetical protein